MVFIKFMLEMKRQWPLMIIGNGMNYQWWSGWIPTRPGFNGPVNFNSKTNTKACSSCWLSARNRLPGKDLNYDCSKSVPPSDQTRDWIACLLLFCCGGWKVIRHGLEWAWKIVVDEMLLATVWNASGKLNRRLDCRSAWSNDKIMDGYSLRACRNDWTLVLLAAICD